MPLIEVKNLEKVYRNDSVATSALAGVSFDINDNEFVAIMGASGSGKSTLLHVLGFLDDYTGGEYRFDGKTVFDYSKDDIAHVRNQKMGFIFQAFNLLARTSVLDNIKLPLAYSSVLPEKWDEGGAIARAIVQNPNVIFADEPTGNLDSKSGGQVMQVIQRLHDEGHTIVLITHETYTAEYAERIITLRDGLIESDRKVMERRRAAEHFVK